MNKLYGKFAALPLWGKIAVVVVIVLLFILIVNAIRKIVDRATQRRIFEQDYNKYCSGQNKGKMSYPQNTYLTLAGKIYEAGCSGVFCYGTDEEAIYDVFRQMKTDCDVILLARAFGKRDERGGLCVSDLWGTSCGRELGEWLQTELSSDAFEEINNILAERGIQSRF